MLDVCCVLSLWLSWITEIDLNVLERSLNFVCSLNLKLMSFFWIYISLMRFCVSDSWIWIKEEDLWFCWTLLNLRTLTDLDEVSVCWILNCAWTLNFVWLNSVEFFSDLVLNWICVMWTLDWCAELVDDELYWKLWIESWLNLRWVNWTCELVWTCIETHLCSWMWNLCDLCEHSVVLKSTCLILRRDSKILKV